MPESQPSISNARSIYVDLSEFRYEAVEQCAGRAIAIRFTLDGEAARQGDVLVVLEGAEIRFHGMISSVDEAGCALAADPRGSMLPVGVQ